jgi:hypothetical protein
MAPPFLTSALDEGEFSNASKKNKQQTIARSSHCVNVACRLFLLSSEVVLWHADHAHIIAWVCNLGCILREGQSLRVLEDMMLRRREYLDLRGRKSQEAG